MPALAAAAPWWQRPGVLLQWVSDLLADELAHLRPGGAALPPRPWGADLPLGEEGLGLDSMERLSVAAALAEALHIHDSGLEDLLLVRRSLGGWAELAAESLQIAGGRISFRTSGSSGVPKVVCHALADLEQEVAHLATLLPGRARVLTAVPTHHIYGFLFGVLLPARLGLPPALDMRQRTPQALAAALQPGDLLVSHPAHWALLARHAPALCAGAWGVSSTAPCPDAVAESLAALGLGRLLQVYGSSETAGIGTRSAPGAPYTLMPHWQRDGAEAGVLLRRHADGLQAPAPLQDRLQWQADGRFVVAGRLDAAVQVLGTNVFPQRVREVLLQHPGVADAAVRRMRPDEGERLKAFIVPAPGTDAAALPDALAAWVQQRLAMPEQPRAFTLGPALPVNAQGKACDWALPALAASGVG